MILAVQSDFKKVKSIFYSHKKWFPHVRTDYMKRMIAKKQMILEDGILITFHHAKRRQKIGDVQLQKGRSCAKPHDTGGRSGAAAVPCRQRHR